MVEIVDTEIFNSISYLLVYLSLGIILYLTTKSNCQTSIVHLQLQMFKNFQCSLWFIV
jgi:hypothetical protein